VVDLKIRKGFIATPIAMIVALFLAMTSAYVFHTGMQTLREEAWMTSNKERSLFPMAWSTANFVLQSLYADTPGFDGPASIFFFTRDPYNLSAPILITDTDPNRFFIPDISDARGVISSEITISGSEATGFRVTSTAFSKKDGILKSQDVTGMLSPHASGWRVVWR